MIADESRVARYLSDDISNAINRIGIMYRIFCRAKERISIETKIREKNYALDGRRLQDLIGIRITLYYADDLELCRELISSLYTVVDETKDQPESDKFSPIRWNVICEIPVVYWEQISIRNKELPIDSTFEVQLRTVFAEGWHEVEHDLRYKHKSDWMHHDDLSRNLNGIVATLEGCDWTILHILDHLAWRHYKSKQWMPMLRCKFRVRIQENEISSEIQELLNSEDEFTRMLFKVHRPGILKKMARSRIMIPITAENLIHIANYLDIKNERVLGMLPAHMKSEFEESGLLEVS